MSTFVGLALVTGALAGDASCMHADPPVPTSGWDGNDLVMSGGRPGLPVDVTLTASLGARTFTWQQHGEFDGEGSLRQTVAAPSGAWLHDAARDYLTDLTVRVHGGGLELGLDPVYLVWPNGPTERARVWTQARASVDAPGGVLRPALRDGLPPGARRLPVMGPSEVTP